jgi:hypothetical protein
MVSVLLRQNQKTGWANAIAQLQAKTQKYRAGVFEKVVGAKGFEPSTSWSRTSGQNHISRCPGVTYWFSGRSQMDKSGQVIAECADYLGQLIPKMA